MKNLNCIYKGSTALAVVLLAACAATPPPKEELAVSRAAQRLYEASFWSSRHTRSPSGPAAERRQGA